MSKCKGYCGLSCVDGSCPIANAEKYEEMCMDVIKKCDDCSFYKGCEDCAFADTEYCEKISREDGTLDLSEINLPCSGKQDCENCVYYGRSSDAPDTVEKDCLYSPEFASEHSLYCGLL